MSGRPIEACGTDGVAFERKLLMSTESLEKLNKMRSYGGEVKSPGLSDAVIMDFAATHPKLVEAIDEAYAHHERLQEERRINIIEVSENAGVDGENRYNQTPQ